MRQFFTFLFILLLATVGYNLLGEYGYHDYWVPVRINTKTNTNNNENDTDETQTIDVKIDLDNIEDQASDLMKSDQVRHAVESLEERLNDLTEDQREKYEPKLVYWLGRGYARVGNQEKARSKFQTYLELRPDSETQRKAEVLYRIGKTYTADLDKRESFFRQAAHLDPYGEVGKKVAEAYPSALGNNPSPVEKLLRRTLRFRHLTESGTDERRQLYEKLNETADAVFRSGDPYLDAETYTVQSGDVLSNIARTFNVGMGWINYTNHRSLPVTGTHADDIATRLRPDDRLVIFPGRLSLVVYIKDTRLSVFYRDLYFVKSYEVGVGKGGAEKTPTGSYVVTNKSAKPRWTHPETGEVLAYDDPENILGTRWIGINLSGYGIHGIDPDLEDTIGTKSSMGCIRMKNINCEELYDMIPNGVQSLPEEHIPEVRIFQ